MKVERKQREIFCPKIKNGGKMPKLRIIKVYKKNYEKKKWKK
jgi:hypothetical protein